jgi:hypothetical protein
MNRGLIGMQELESECLKPGPSEKLAQIGLALLKHVSSHKGLTYAPNMSFCLDPSDRIQPRYL